MTRLSIACEVEAEGSAVEAVVVDHANLESQNVARDLEVVVSCRGAVVI